MSLSGKGKMKADEVMAAVSSNKDMEDENVVALGDNNATLKPIVYTSSDKKEEEGNSEVNAILLIEVQLGVVTTREDEGEEFARVRGQVTPWKLFDSTNQPSPFPFWRTGFLSSYYYCLPIPQEVGRENV